MRTFVTMLVALGVLAGAAALCSPAAAGETTVYADADAYVDQTYPNTNYGDADFVRVGGPMTMWHGFFRFDLSSLNPNKAVTSATLELIEVDKDGWDPGAYVVHFTRRDWDEDTITYNNWDSGEAGGDPNLTITHPMIYREQGTSVWSVDITRFVKLWLGQDSEYDQQPNCGVHLMRPPAGPWQGHIEWGSREADASERPVIVVQQED